MIPLPTFHVSITKFGDCFQLVCLDLIRKVCSEQHEQKVCSFVDFSCVGSFCEALVLHVAE